MLLSFFNRVAWHFLPDLGLHSWCLLLLSMICVGLV